MDAQSRTALTAALSSQVAAIAESQRKRMLEDAAIRAAAEQLHADEKVGQDFEVWTDLLSRRGAVLWVLKSVYVRVLEDRGLLSPKRIVDRASTQLFETLAPDLGESSYLRWVYRDLGHADGGLPELFAPQPAEVCVPADAHSRALLDFWRERDPDTGELRWSFADESFDGRLMGDLYQDLDPVVKARFALVQTPDFVLEFMLDETLTPAIAEFGIDEVRLLDPACGSGHFLLEGFKRLVAGVKQAHPDWTAAAVVNQVLPRVVGIDLNDYACGLARARLVMTALELMGSTDLADATELHPQVFWADGLEQVEIDMKGQISLDLGGVEEKPQATLTQPEVRAKLRPVLEAGFHVVVANPPYITEKDAARRAYHREKQGKERRYESASGKYSLGNPFTERMFQLCVEGGYVGDFNANSFMKREMGKGLIKKVLPKYRLTKVIDTSGAYFPGYGTPTVLLFGRRLRPNEDAVLVVGGKRGEPGKPKDASRGLVWSSVVEGHATPAFENDYVSVAEVEAAKLREHPWSIGGGGAAELTNVLTSKTGHNLGSRVASIGFASFAGTDEVFVLGRTSALRLGCPSAFVKPFVAGEAVRDWVVTDGSHAVAPYDDAHELVSLADLERGVDHFWTMRTSVLGTLSFGGHTRGENGDSHWSWYRWQADRYRTRLSITFAFKATHNHFVLDRGGKVFKQTAPVIKLPEGATVAEHLALLGQLNSSTACFWMKQVCHNCGYSAGAGGGRTTAEPFDDFYEHDGTKLQSFPVATKQHAVLEQMAARVTELASARQARSARAVITDYAADPATPLRQALDQRQAADLQDLASMVGLQEELDWLCYQLYGLDEAPDDEQRHVDAVPPLTPGQRGFELSLAKAEDAKAVAAAAGEESSEPPTAWFTRHGWDPVTDLADIPEAWRAITEARIARTAANRNLQLIEQPQFKRRWYRPDYEKEEQAAMREWLADRVEEEAKTFSAPFTPRQLAARLQDDPAVEAVATLHEGAGFDLDRLVHALLHEGAVPNTKHHIYKKKALAKRAAWQKTWALQHAEDAWDAQLKRHKDALANGVESDAAPPKPKGERPTPPVPPKYTSADFLRSEAWKQRGKLDVPKERFIAFTGVPAELTAAGPLYGWAGWTHRQRAEVLMALDEQADDAGVAVPERYGLLYGVQFLMPYVSWDAEAHGLADEYQGILTDLLGDAGVTEGMLDEWAASHPAPKPPAKKRAKKPKTKKRAKKPSADKASKKNS